MVLFLYSLKSRIFVKSKEMRFAFRKYMVVDHLHLKSIGLVIALKTPIQDESAKFLTELFDQPDIKDSITLIGTQPDRIDESTVNVLLECVFHILENGGHVNEAITIVQMALLLANALGNKAILSETLATAGWVFYKSGQFEKSQEYVEKAKEIYSQLGLLTEVQTMNNAATMCKDAIQKRTMRLEEKCDICGNEFPVTDGEHIVVSRKPQTMQKAAHCFNCGIVVCFGCAVWHQNERFIGQEDDLSKNSRTPYCPLCGQVLG
jgi:tetratricopeptide (TPR) repeat protein